jgi:hypothetical protein
MATVAQTEFHPEVIHFANNTLIVPSFRTGGYLPLYHPQSSLVTQIPFTQMLAVLVRKFVALVCSDGPGSAACGDTAPKEIRIFTRHEF